MTFKEIRPLYEAVYGKANTYSDGRWIEFFMTDNYGRSIYVVNGANNVKTKRVLLFESDGSYNASICVMIKDCNYQDDFKAFKELNNWNQPY